MREIQLMLSSEATETVRLTLSEEVVAQYSLEKWAKGFDLMTAGYRDRLNPADAASPLAPFNAVTVAILAEAKARVFQRALASGTTGQVHLGGETRPHTQTFIRIAARVYAAHGFQVHLRQTLKTTPIWYTSFGVFYEGYQSGDNFTASHSQCYKGGWKPVDGLGQQLLSEAPLIVEEVRRIVKNRDTIVLAPWVGNSLIHADLNADAGYLNFQNSVLGEHLIERLREACRSGFKCSVCTMGGSMKATSERLFAAMGIATGPDAGVAYYFGEEDSEYHKIGQVGKENYGVDPSSRRIYRTVGAQEKLFSGAADIVLMWDPDGDRLNVVTKAPIGLKDAALAVGLEVDEQTTATECVVYFTPNQLYLMLAAFRIDELRASGGLKERDWFLGITFPTSRSIEELAVSEGLPCVRVPVGFKYLGNLCATLEAQLGKGPVVFESAIGERVELGANPRALILCEESGGATLGGRDLLMSRAGSRGILALREKDAMQLGLLSLCLAVTLHRERSSFTQYYCDLVRKKSIRFLHYERNDVHLYDEGLLGPALEAAKAEGFRKRDRVIDFFARLADEHKAGRLSLAEAQAAINRVAASGTTPVPPLRRACRAGDDFLHGMLFETDELRIIIRASGTDALLRYYVEGVNLAAVKAMLQTLKGLNL